MWQKRPYTSCQSCVLGLAWDGVMEIFKAERREDFTMLNVFAEVVGELRLFVGLSWWPHSLFQYNKTFFLHVVTSSDNLSSSVNFAYDRDSFGDHLLTCHNVNVFIKNIFSKHGLGFWWLAILCHKSSFYLEEQTVKNIPSESILTYAQ